MTIEAIDSWHDGIYFRSRLEARQSIYFTKLGIKWEYEPKAFLFGYMGYLPDFCFPEFKLWVEIKPTMGADLEKPVRLAKEGERVVVLCGGAGGCGCWTNALTVGVFVATDADFSRDLKPYPGANFGVCEKCQRPELLLAPGRFRCPCGGTIVRGGPVDSLATFKLFAARETANAETFDCTPLPAILARRVEDIARRSPEMRRALRELAH